MATSVRAAACSTESPVKISPVLACCESTAAERRSSSAVRPAWPMSAASPASWAASAGPGFWCARSSESASCFAATASSSLINNRVSAIASRSAESRSRARARACRSDERAERCSTAAGATAPCDSSSSASSSRAPASSGNAWTQSLAICRTVCCKCRRAAGLVGTTVRGEPLTTSAYGYGTAASVSPASPSHAPKWPVSGGNARPS